MLNNKSVLKEWTFLSDTNNLTSQKFMHTNFIITILLFQ